MQNENSPKDMDPGKRDEMLMYLMVANAIEIRALIKVFINMESMGDEMVKIQVAAALKKQSKEEYEELFQILKVRFGALPREISDLFEDSQM
jgi:hypothetical protein